MNVGIIRVRDREGSDVSKRIVAVVEWPEDVSAAQLMDSWLGQQGLASLNTVADIAKIYRIERAFVTPWSDLRTTWVAFKDQKWVIGRDGIPHHFWLSGSGWVQGRDKASVYDGYSRQEMKLPDGGHWKYIGPDYQPQGS